jgi:hypothetical protein
MVLLDRKCWLFVEDLRILLCSLHMLISGNNTKVSPAGWSVHWLHAENVGWNSKFQTLTLQQSRLKQPQHVPVILKLCATQTSWFRPWHATRNVVSLVAENRPDFPRTDPPRAHLQLSSWFHTFVDLATHILTTRMTAKGMQLCRRNSWRHFANRDQKTCIQMCVCIYIYILCVYVYIYIYIYIYQKSQSRVDSYLLCCFHGMPAWFSTVQLASPTMTRKKNE